MEYIRLSSSRHIDKDTGIYYHFVDSDSEHFYAHYHEFYEIMIFLNDAYQILNGEKRLEKKGTVMLLGPEDRHLLLRESKFSMHNIAFSVKCAENIFSFFDTDGKMTSVVISERELEKLHNSISRINTLGIERKNEQARQFKGVLINVFTKHLLKITREEEEIPYWMQALNAKMRYHKNFTAGIDKMVELSGKSREHISRSYRKYLHVTPSEFINDIKLNYAANLLINSNMSILDISLESGFENLAWFYEVFKKKFNKTPKNFRKEN